MDVEDEAVVGMDESSNGKEVALMLFHRAERGQGMVEYALIIVLIAIVIVIALTIFGTELSTVYSRIVHDPHWP